jgi:hypothetical protein
MSVLSYWYSMCSIKSASAFPDLNLDVEIHSKLRGPVLAEYSLNLEWIFPVRYGNFFSVASFHLRSIQHSKFKLHNSMPSKQYKGDKFRCRNAETIFLCVSGLQSFATAPTLFYIFLANVAENTDDFSNKNPVYLQKRVKERSSPVRLSCN